MTTIERFEDRALEPLAQYMIRNLLVPEVYWRPDWGDSASAVPLLAIDRAGRGDVHVVQVLPSGAAVYDGIERVMGVNAHYRWLAFPADDPPAPEAHRSLDPTSGPGRIGLIEVFEMNGRGLGARRVTAAERFMTFTADDVHRLHEQRPPDQSFG